jgi:hypothetical protein
MHMGSIHSWNAFFLVGFNINLCASIIAAAHRYRKENSLIKK